MNHTIHHTGGQFVYEIDNENGSFPLRMLWPQGFAK